MKIIKDKDGNIINIGEWEYNPNPEDDEIVNPLPEGAYEEEISKKDYNKLLEKIQKTEEYKSELRKIDEKAIRSIRAILCNKGTEDDIAYLNSLEEQATKKRNEMNNL